MLNEKIIKICEQKFIYLNYSPRTSENYMYHIKDFIRSVGEKQVIHLNSKDFQFYLDNYSFSSVSQQNQVINSIRFLYKFALERKYDKVSFKRPRSERKLPKIIDKDFLLNAINKITNTKHKVIISLYCSKILIFFVYLNNKTAPCFNTIRFLIITIKLTYYENYCKCSQ